MTPGKDIIWSIGHSTHTIEDFTAMLQSFNIELVADIRSYPGSAHFPQFNKQVLEYSLKEKNINYSHLLNLGGRRKVNTHSINTGWHHPAFRGYADYMETEEFKKAISELEQSAKKYRTAYMCAEALWWRCHRLLVSDYLKNKGWTVVHITGKGKSQEHNFTTPARIVDGKLMYYTEPEIL